MCNYPLIQLREPKLDNNYFLCISARPSPSTERFLGGTQEYVL